MICELPVTGGDSVTVSSSFFFFILLLLLLLLERERKREKTWPFDTVRLQWTKFIWIMQLFRLPVHKRPNWKVAWHYFVNLGCLDKCFGIKQNFQPTFLCFSTSEIALFFLYHPIRYRNCHPETGRKYKIYDTFVDYMFYNDGRSYRKLIKVDIE